MKKYILAILLITISLMIVYRDGIKKVRKSETPIENDYTKWASLLQNTSNYRGNWAFLTPEDGRMIMGTRSYPRTRQGRIRFILTMPSSLVADTEEFEFKWGRKKTGLQVMLNENIEDKATYAFYYDNKADLNKKQIQELFKKISLFFHQEKTGFRRSDTYPCKSNSNLRR